MSCGKFIFQGIERNFKNFKELEVPLHVVNSSFKEVKGIWMNLKQL